MGALEDLVASHLGDFSPEGGVHLPDTPGYDACLSAAAGANYACLHERRRPPCALQPACERDVVLAVRFVTAGIERGLWGSTENDGDGVPMTLCGGGHSELCVRHGAVLIHFVRMNSTRCDPATASVTIGPGALLGQVNECAQTHGLAVPTGVFAGVGVGSILAGGIGRLARKRGLSVQSVVAMRVVTADGTVRTLGSTNADMDELEREMWWGCRGAAAALAVVTAVTLRAYQIPKTVEHGRLIHPPSPNAAAAADRLTAIEAIARGLPEGIQVDVCATRGAGGGGGGGVTLGVFPCAVDGDLPADVARELGLETKHLTKSRYCDVPYHSMLPDDGDGDGDGDEKSAPGDGDGVPSQATPGMFSYVRQWFVDELGADGAAAVAAAAAAAPTDDSLIMMQHAGGAVRRGGPDGDDEPMAFPHREWEWSVVIIALWTDPGADSRSAAESWADDAFDSLRGVGVGCYAVDIDRFRRPGNAAETETALAFGDGNAARLRELKRRVDPSNLFAAAAPL